ncbi:TOBE domain-containing protein [Laribacter hongkongensis]|uniref:TOBE domain-containing protein n=1 Tax=Laribacter hongkongensis TaxID=168471 RepID=UPI001EFC3AB1|nr:TOBE domain-containing protein [Laribacter hongkongensis]MCG9054017.1 TOBE domain-containing protein [Laribacter hongkongensis]
MNTPDLHGELILSHGSRKLADARQMRLLAAIDTTGSITRAAREAGISYKSAWDTLDAMNHLSPTPLVARATGGKGGGGTRLTQAGRDLLAVYHAIEAEQQRLLATLAPHVDDAAATLNLLSRLRTMRTSARNQFLGRVSAIHTGAVNDEITLTLPGGQNIVAIVTADSRQTLGLETGGEAVALIKASSVLIACGDGLALSARNQLCGQIADIRSGAVNDEIILELAGSTRLVAVITCESTRRLGLATGMTVTAAFKASHVILAVPA